MAHVVPKFENPALRAEVLDFLNTVDNEFDAGAEAFGLRRRAILAIEGQRGHPLAAIEVKFVYEVVDEVQGLNVEAQDELLAVEEVEGLQSEDCQCRRHLYTLSQPLAQLLGSQIMPFHKAIERVRRLILEEQNPDPEDHRFALLGDQLANILNTHRVNKKNLWPVLSPLMTPLQPNCPCCI